MINAELKMADSSPAFDSAFIIHHSAFGMSNPLPYDPSAPPPRRSYADLPFLLCFALIGGLYVLLIVGMLLADAKFTTPGHLWQALLSDDIRAATRLSLISCTVTTILSVWVAVPLGYLLSRWDDRSIRGFLDRLAGPPGSPGRVFAPVFRVFNPKVLLDTILDIPIVLPPLVIGLSLLILMQTAGGRWFEAHVLGVTYAVPSIILAQFSVACAFAVRTMRVTFDQIMPRGEQVALTLGCGRGQAFWLVALPEARRGVLTAATLAWARSLGEFGPILIFSGATRMKTEVLSTSVWLELSVGNIEAAVAVSLLMVIVAVVVLVIMRLAGSARAFGEAVLP
jgi:molybdate transport system permease protein